MFLSQIGNNWSYFITLEFTEDQVLYCARWPGSSEETIWESAKDVSQKDLCSVSAAA